MLFSPGAPFYAAKMRLVLKWLSSDAESSTDNRSQVSQLAHEAGLPNSYIHHLLAGRITSPSYNHLVSLALAAGFDPAWWQVPLEENGPQLLKHDQSPGTPTND